MKPLILLLALFAPLAYAAPETAAFAPLYTTANLVTSVSVSSTNSSATASAAFNFGGAGASGGSGGTIQVQIANTTNAWAYVNFGIVGSLSAATVAASYPVAPGAVVVVSVAPYVSGASVILGSAPGAATNVIFTIGQGV